MASSVPAVESPSADDNFDGPTEPASPPDDRASQFDGIVVDGVPVGVAMATSRSIASGGDYGATSPNSSASGAYQINDATWDRYQGYEHAVDAPPIVQDQFSYERMVEILGENGNDESAIPVAWYNTAAVTKPRLLKTVEVKVGEASMTLRRYQRRWMKTFDRLLVTGSPIALPADSDPLVPAIAFPVLGPVRYVDDWHYARSGGRVHEGLDFIGSYGQPLRAAFDGQVVRIVGTDTGISGVSIEIRRADDLRAVYRHVNNDTPATTDNSANEAFRVHPGIEAGSSVRAGQIIGYMGDTGNARGLPHLHFELRNPTRIPGDRTPFAPFPSTEEAREREQCSVGLGPWSTAFESPAAIADALEAFGAMGPSELAGVDANELLRFDDAQLETLALSDEQRSVLAAQAPAVPFLIEGPDGARWTIAADGSVAATGSGALIVPNEATCDEPPQTNMWFGSDAAGVTVDALPANWWGDEASDTQLDSSHDDRVDVDVSDVFVPVSPVLG